MSSKRTAHPVRNLVRTISLLLFPVTFNWFSPYVIIDGAANGIISGSALVFVALFLSSPLLGRAWCSWICPAGTIQDLFIATNGKKFISKLGDLLKYLIWGVWMGTIIFLFASSGYAAINPLHLTESGISVDAPQRYIIYLGVIFLFSAIALAFGRRAACHSICWMAPFMIFGRKLGNLASIPGYRLSSNPDRCISCGSCEKACPLSLDIAKAAKAGRPELTECIQCGDCVKACASGALTLGFSPAKRRKA